MLFNIFEVGYYFFDPKFTVEFSRKFKDAVSFSPVLWEENNYEWLVFPYRDVDNGSLSSLKFRNIVVKKGTEKWDKVGIRTVKLSNENKNQVSVFGYENLFFDAPILFIVEGEFDAITLTLSTNALYPAISVGSVSNFTVEKIKKIAEIAKDKAIIVLPDWDVAGQQALNRLIEQLDYKFLKKHKLFAIPKASAENIKDIDEYLCENYDTALEKVELLLENAVSLVDLKKQKEEGKKKEQEEKLKEYPAVVQSLISDNYVVNIDEEFEDVCLSSLDEQIKEKEYILRGLRRGEVGFLIARGGTGKSFLSIYFSIILSSSLTELEDVFIPYRQNAKKVLYLNLEDPADIFKKRQKAIINKIAQTLQYRYTPGEIFNSCKNNLIVKRPKKLFNLFTDNRGELVVNEKNFEKLNVLIKKYNTTLLIIDTFSKVSFIQESSNHLISEALARMQYFAETNNIAILILHHTSKFANLNNIASADAARGATALYNNVRYVLQMQKVPVDTQKIKEIEKNFNSKDLMKHINNLSEDTRKRSVIVYESKNNFSKQVAYVYEKDKDGALYLTHSEPFEVDV